MRVSCRVGVGVGAAFALVLAAPVLLTLTVDRDRGTRPAAATVSAVQESPLPSLVAPTPSPSARPSPSASPAVAAEDAAVGILATAVPRRAGGTLVVVPGRLAAPGNGRVLRVRVEVERGLPVDSQVFAGFVLRTLNDPRGWGARGRMSFARTDADDQDLRVVLASPATNAVLCRPLDTRGQASCGRDGRAVLTFLRWVRTTPEFTTMRTVYRQYMVNHEVGHLLGHPHEMCPRVGALAPVMQQQTYGLEGCRPNPWPHP